MQNFILPHPNWTAKHGNVYCSICKDKTQVAMVPTARKSVVFRREHAACKNCISVASEKIDRANYLDYGSSDSEAANQIYLRYGVVI